MRSPARSSRQFTLHTIEPNSFFNESTEFKIDLKHRREQYHATLDEKLYSSLRYQLRLQIRCEAAAQDSCDVSECATEAQHTNVGCCEQDATTEHLSHSADAHTHLQPCSHNGVTPAHHSSSDNTAAAAEHHCLKQKTCLEARVLICDEANDEPLDEQHLCLDGTLCAPLISHDEDASLFTCNLLIHVRSHLSFHFTRKDYKFMVVICERRREVAQPQVCDASGRESNTTHIRKDTDTTPELCSTTSMLSSMLSPPFRLFARKPNKKQYSRIKKRKLRESHDTLEADDDMHSNSDVLHEPLRKKQKLTHDDEQQHNYRTNVQTTVQQHPLQHPATDMSSMFGAYVAEEQVPLMAVQNMRRNGSAAQQYSAQLQHLYTQDALATAHAQTYPTFNQYATQEALGSTCAQGPGSMGPVNPLNSPLNTGFHTGLDSSGGMGSESSFHHVYPVSQQNCTSGIAPERQCGSLVPTDSLDSAAVHLFDPLSTMAMYQQSQFAYNLFLQQQIFNAGGPHSSSSFVTPSQTHEYYQQALQHLPYGAPPLNY
mmetsp:Transcript_4681/g.17597  ORF Transcript_4681/g.17597 Transcript_4681/m.17597 type:complete len:542 (-) Transcript_4681:1549-3174(-)|eukprot:CAMPEP_0117436188 /NCGR_PEP_ID=MMETSP0759-20121206/878_1 /TAXON_ID=63605 /ORGANISM="Percolomonas cosmopolitus, Strain WS" /LENGTH=541 /DNA_ID=CAMNT_0005227779 /DNA_START=210 /DNA_END=1835 /DNA_ORIENTATION=+